jgi:ADP-ribose pyrophosphatase
MDSGLSKYLRLERRDPALFTNPSTAGFTIVLDRPGIRSVEEVAAQRLAQDGHPQEWSRVGVVHEDQYIMVLRDAVLFPDGRLDTYMRIIPKHGGGVAVLPVLDTNVVLVRHFRHATRSWHLEIPRGFLSKRTPPSSGAAEELFEEIGASARTMSSLGTIYPDTGVSSDCVELFYAKIDSIGEADAHEAIDEILPVEVGDLESMIGDARLTDSFTIAAYVRAKLRGLLPPRAK